MNQWDTELRRALEQLHSIEQEKAAREQQIEDEIEHFFISKVLPACATFKRVVTAYERGVTIQRVVDSVLLCVLYENTHELEIGIFVEPASAAGILPFFRILHPGRTMSGEYGKEYEYFYKDQKLQTAADLSIEDILQRVEQAYTQRVQHLLTQALADVKPFSL